MQIPKALAARVATGTLALSLLLAIASCGGSGEAGGSGTVTLQSIALTPSSAQMVMGASVVLVATATYSDGSHQDISAQTTWSSSNTAVTTVAAGIALGVSTGTATINAALQGRSGSATLTVKPAVLLSIAVTPANLTLTAGTTQPFTATGLFSDNTTQNLTAQATWASSATPVATVSNAVGTVGQLTAVGPGTSTLSAATTGISASTVVTVTPATGLTMLFEQPQENGIAGHLFVPKATHTGGPPKGVFELVFWQLNPNTSNGELVPSSWDTGSTTGFTPSSPLSNAQLGFYPNTPGTTTAQMDGSTVGAYLNSQDLPGSPVGQKMMIAPQFLFSTGQEPVPFSSANQVLNGSLYLQVPVAQGNDTYVLQDLLFIGPNGVRISYGAKLFVNGASHPVVGAGYAADSNTYEVNSPLGIDQTYVSLATGSASAANTPWLGWRYFAWSISAAQFAAALGFLNTQFPGVLSSTNPADYLLAEVHLNAEYHFQPAPAQLGWSLYGMKIWLTST